MKRGFAFSVLFLIMVTGVMAGFDYRGNSLVKTYSAGEIVKGKVNVSFDAESANGVLTSNFIGNITLIDFLELNDLVEEIDYECSISGCENDYSHSGSANSFSLDNKKIIGFVISNRQDVSILESKFKIKSDAESSCFKQISFDFLNKGDSVLTNYGYLDEACSSKNYGCFENNVNSESAVIQSNADYCEKISLPSAPAYRIGAKIKNSTQGAATLKMKMYDSEGEFLDECVLPKNSQDEQELSCIIDYPSVSSDEFFVCVSAAGNSNYKIKSETNNPCGNNDPRSDTFNSDFEIFAQNLKFDNVEFEINNSAFSRFGGDIELVGYIDDYIEEKYDRNCVPKCVVPIAVFGVEQNVEITEANIIFNAGGNVIESSSIFNLAVVNSTLDSGYLSLDIEKAGFGIPIGSMEKKFELFIDGKKIFSEPINISESFDFKISPKFVAFGQNGVFSVVSNFSINNTTWNFGDGAVEKVSGSRATHRYLEEGTFNIEVEARRSDGVKSKRVFSVRVGNAKLIINSTIADYKKRIGDIESDIDSFAPIIRRELNSSINLEIFRDSLGEIEKRYNNASADEEYNEVMSDLLELAIPISVGTSNKGSVPLLFGSDKIDTSYVESLSSEVVGSEQNLESAIIAWMDENFDSVISFQRVNAFFESDDEPILTYFKVETKPKNDFGEAYLFLDYDKEALDFGGNYGALDVAGGTYLNLNAEGNVFEFVVKDEIEVSELGAYISPLISELGDLSIEFDLCNFNNVCEKALGENAENCRNDCKPWGKFALWISLLVFAAFVVYIILQEWYKRNYEKSLFKNPDDLYNLINFIYNARVSGLKDSEIRNKLKNSGWKGESITYALRKIDGKRTGMFEIPILKFLENKKVKEELTKRQGKPIDARFIKRPLLR